MHETIDRARDRRLDRLPVAGAVGVGLILGSLARDLPIAVAGWIHPGSGSKECGDQSIAECAISSVPEAMGNVIVFGAIVLAVTVLFVVVGLPLLVMGVRLARLVPERDSAESDPADNRVITGWALVALGTSLVIPAVWLAASAIGLV